MFGSDPPLKFPPKFKVPFQKPTTSSSPSISYPSDVTSSPSPTSVKRPMPKATTAKVAPNTSKGGYMHSKVDLTPSSPSGMTVKSVSDLENSSTLCSSPLTPAPSQKKKETKGLLDISKALEELFPTLSFQTCAEKDVRAKLNDVMEAVDELYEAKKGRLDEGENPTVENLGVRLWNTSLIIKQAAGKPVPPQLTASVAVMRRTACFLLDLSKLEGSDLEYAQRIVNVCARTAMDLLDADERTLAKDIVDLAAENVEPLEDIEKSAENGAYPPELNIYEAICAYRLARFRLDQSKNDATLEYVIKKALKCCEKLPGSNWALRTTVKYIIQFSTRLIKDAESQLGKDETEDTFQQAKQLLGFLCEFLEKLKINDKCTFYKERLDAALLLARAQFQVGKSRKEEEYFLAAEHTIRQVSAIAKANGEKTEALKASLTLLAMMEDRKASVDSLKKVWENLIPGFEFEETHINNVVKILFRSTIRKAEGFQTYVISVVRIFSKTMAESQLDRISCAMLIGRLGYVAVRAVNADCIQELKEIFDVIAQSKPPIQLSADVVHAWLDVLMKRADECCKVDGEARSAMLLELAANPLFAKIANVAYAAIKKAAYMYMVAGQHGKCQELINDHVPVYDPATWMIVTVSMIRQGKEMEAMRILQKMSEKSPPSPDVLLWIISEAIKTGLITIQSKAMELFLDVCDDKDHDINNIRLLRTVISKHIDVLQSKGKKKEESEAYFLHLLERYISLMSIAAEEDRTSREKSQEIDWMASTLYNLRFEPNADLCESIQDQLHRVTVNLVDLRETFSEPIKAELHSIRLFSSVYFLEGFMKSASECLSVEETKEQWKRIGVLVPHLEEYIEKAKKANKDAVKDFDQLDVYLLSIRIRICLNLEDWNSIKILFTREEDPLDRLAIEEAADLIVGHVQSPPDLISCAVFRLLWLFWDDAQATKTYNAKIFAKWIHLACQRLLSNPSTRHTHHDLVIQYLDHILLPILASSYIVPNPDWPFETLMYLQVETRKLANELVQLNEIQSASKLIEISQGIIANTKEIPPAQRMSEECRLRVMQKNIDTIFQSQLTRGSSIQ